MAITFGIHASAGSSDGSTATTPARTTTPGSTVAIVAQNYSGGVATAPAITDNKGNTFTLIPGALAGGMSGSTPTQTETLAIFYCENILGGAGHTFKVTGSYYPSITVVELLGNMVKYDTGKLAIGMDSASPFTAGPITPSASGAAIISGIVPKTASSGAHTLASPGATIEDITDVNNYFLVALGGFIQATAAAYTASWTVADGSTQNAVGVAAFIETGGGGPASYTLTAAGSTFALSGSAASLLYAQLRTLAADSGSLSFTGSSATLTANVPPKLAANGGTVAFTGSAVTLRYASRAPTLGGHTMAYDYDNLGTDPRTTDPITTQSGSTLLVLVGIDNPNDSQPTDNYGNTFSRVTPRINYNLWPGYGVSAWKATDIVGGAGHTVTVQKDAFPGGEVSIYVAEVRGAGNIVGGMSETLKPNDLVSAPVTVGTPALFLASWWGDNTIGPHTAVARDGYTPLESILIQGSIIQSAAAYKIEDAPGTYSVGWDETPQQGALLGLFGFEASSGPTFTAGAGSISLAGSSASLTKHLIKATDAGSVTLTGSSANLAKHYVLPANSGSLTNSGGSASLIANRVLSADASVYVVQGFDAMGIGARRLDADPGMIQLSGSDVQFPVTQPGSYQIGAGQASVLLSGSSAEFTRHLVFLTDSGSVQFSGSDVEFPKGQVLFSEGGSWQLIGQDVSWRQGRILRSDSGSVLLTGMSVTMTYSEAKTPIPGIVIQVPGRYTSVQAPSKTTITL